MLGMGKFDLNRRRTRLSIPFGLRHESPTRIKRWDWKRLNALVRFFTIGGCDFAVTAAMIFGFDVGVCVGTGASLCVYETFHRRGEGRRQSEKQSQRPTLILNIFNRSQDYAWNKSKLLG